MSPIKPGLLIGLGLVAALAVDACQAQELKATVVPPMIMNCEPVADLQSNLLHRYHERLVIMGPIRGAGHYRLYYHDGGGSWTMVWVKPNGNACVRMFGTHRSGFFGNEI